MVSLQKSSSNNSRRALERLHADVDEATGRIVEVVSARLQCRRGCSSCCVDDITVFEVEADRIRVSHPQLLIDGEPHVPGACAFLDASGACRVYADRPYVCRTQGLPLRWFEDDEARDDIVERRAICPLNEAGPPLESLPDDQTWLLGPTEERLAGIEQDRSGSQDRVSLRSLFRNSAK